MKATLTCCMAAIVLATAPAAWAQDAAKGAPVQPVDRDSIGQMPPADLAARMRAWAEKDSKAAKALLPDCEKVWLAADAARPLPLAAANDIVWAYRHTDDSVHAGAWGKRACDATLGKAEVRNTLRTADLEKLSTLMIGAGMLGPGKGSNIFAETLAGLARAGALNPPPKDFETLADPLGTPEARAILEKDLADARGNPRFPAAKILAQAYRKGGLIKDWRKTLDAKIDAAKGDCKAFWYLAKGYAEPLAWDTPRPTARQRWIEEALVAAETDAGKLAVLVEMAEYYRSIKRPAVAAQAIESVMEQLQGKPRADAEALLAGVNRETETQKAAEEESKAAADKVRNAATLKYFRSCLAKSKDETESAKLREAIRKLELESEAR